MSDEKPIVDPQNIEPDTISWWDPHEALQGGAAHDSENDTTGGRLARSEARAAQMLDGLAERKRSASDSLAKECLSLAEPDDRLLVTDWPDGWSGNTVDARDIADVTARIDALLHRHNHAQRPAAIVFDIANRDDPELTSAIKAASQQARRHNCQVTVITDEWAGRVDELT